MSESLTVYTIMPGSGKWNAKSQLPGAVSTVAYSLIKVSRFKHYVVGDESDIPQEGAEYIPVKKRILGLLIGKKYHIAFCKKLSQGCSQRLLRFITGLYIFYICVKSYRSINIFFISIMILRK